MAAEKSNISNVAAVPLIWDEDDEGLSQECKDLIANLPAEPNLLMNRLYQYQGVWLSKRIIQAILNCQNHFQALDSDVILVTLPKSGSTWFKALTFAILNRKTHHPNPTQMSSTHPLLTANPHALVRTLETTLYNGQAEPDLSFFSSPRIFSTHMPYVLLPESIKSSRCKIVYLCRNPKDQFVSLWHFMNKLKPELQQLQEDNMIVDSFEQFCRGVSPWGPFWDQMLAYYKESLEKPNKIMFVKYEDMKGKPDRVLKDLAGFMGYGFSKEEEADDIVGDILRLCSFENLSNLEVNNSGKLPHGIEHNAFFRRGNVGDWKNFLTSDMAERLDVVIQEKLEKHSLKF